MIAHLSGKVLSIRGDYQVIDVSGVGYKVRTSTDGVLQGDEVSLLIHTVVRENEIALYGFKTEDELSFFEMLLGVKGVGPKTAFTISSSSNIGELLKSIGEADVSALSTIPGVGKKTATRIIVELSEKVGDIKELMSNNAKYTDTERDAIDGLVSLGFDKKKTQSTIRDIYKKTEGDINVSDLVKRGLEILSGTQK